jgi:lipopolysaccharide transport system ATP-binding protein
LGPGEYVFEVGLASVAMKMWQNREHISHEEMSSNHIRICHIANVGSFSIRLAEKNGISVLTHHGIANLPGKLKITTFVNQEFL